MKAVLISIQPKWCELIAIGRKKLELRKTFPNLPLPFKCYIYQTKKNWVYRWAAKLGFWKLAEILPHGRGKVIGEFICFAKMRHCETKSIITAEKASCVRQEDIVKYADGKEIFGWGICDLVIYDEPKPLSKFRSYNCGCKWESGYPIPTHEIKRPPQSWCYVEEMGDG